jgi:anti-sigma-K factor RskA
MSSDKEQKGIDVPQHKRIAMGEKLDGTSYNPKGGSKSNKPTGGLSHVKKK